MNDPTKTEDTGETSVSGDTPAPFNLQTSGRVNAQITEPQDDKVEVGQYKGDLFESLPSYERIILIGVGFFILTGVVFGFGGFDIKTVEIFITAI